MDNHCLICKKIIPFSISKRKRKFCSQKCFIESRKHRINTKCDFCQKQIIITISDYRQSKHHFCSRECHFQFKIKTRFKIKCNYCSKILYLHPYKKKKKQIHHFCSHICYQKFRSKDALGEVKCSFCKNKFKIKKIRKNKQKRFFCGRKCFNKFQSEADSKLIICLECKKKFRVPLSLLKSGRGKFCNKKCFIQYMRKRQYKEFFCLSCGKKTHRKKFRFRRYHKRGYFCSKKCHGKWESQNIVGKNHHNYNRKEKKCAFCKKKILVLNCSVKKNRNSFCDRKCYGKWQSKHIIGKNSPCWINGNAHQEYPRAFNYSLKEFIRKRDAYKCQNKSCGIPQKECIKTLHIHHIDYDRKNNDPINLIALCYACHQMITNRNYKYWQNYYEEIQIERKVHELEKYIN